RGRSAVVRGQLQALILRRVMARRHVDPANRMAFTNRVSDDGRGRVAVAEQRNETIGGEHFGGCQGKLAAQKTGVVAKNHDRLALEEVGLRTSDFGIKKIRDALCGEADVVEGEIARDQPAPAACSKSN